MYTILGVLFHRKLASLNKSSISKPNGIALIYNLTLQNVTVVVIECAQ